MTTESTVESGRLPFKDSEQGAALLALVVGCLSVLRIVLFGFLDRRPRFGGAHSSDLAHLARNHQAFSNPSGVDVPLLLENARLEHHQPQLWYTGVVGLLGGFDSLSYGLMCLVNAAGLGLALWTGWAFAVRVSGPRLGVLSVTLMASLPMVAGRCTMVGVEPTHMGLLGLVLLLTLRLREPTVRPRVAVALGAVVGVGLLMKLTFIAPIALVIVAEFLAALRGGGRPVVGSGSSWVRPCWPLCWW